MVIVLAPENIPLFPVRAEPLVGCGSLAGSHSSHPLVIPLDPTTGVNSGADGGALGGADGGGSKPCGGVEKVEQRPSPRPALATR